MADRASVADGLNAIIDSLDILIEMSVNPLHRREVAAEEIRIRQVISRAKLALSFVEAQRPVDIRRAN